MIEIVIGVVLVLALAVVVLWLIGLRATEEEELAGLVTANWDRIESRIDDDAGADADRPAE